MTRILRPLLLSSLFLSLACASGGPFIEGDSSGLIQVELGAIRTGEMTRHAPLTASGDIPAAPEPATIDVTISNNSHDPITVESLTLTQQSGSVVTFPPATQRLRKMIEPGAEESFTMTLNVTPSAVLGDPRRSWSATVRAILKLQSGTSYAWTFEVPVG